MFLKSWHLSQVVRPGSAKPSCLSSNLSGASIYLNSAGVAESADAQDLKSCGVTTVPVQVWPPAPKKSELRFAFFFAVYRLQSFSDIICFAYKTNSECACIDT